MSGGSLELQAVGLQHNFRKEPSAQRKNQTFFQTKLCFFLQTEGRKRSSLLPPPLSLPRVPSSTAPFAAPLRL